MKLKLMLSAGLVEADAIALNVGTAESGSGGKFVVVIGVCDDARIVAQEFATAEALNVFVESLVVNGIAMFGREAMFGNGWGE